MEKMTRTEETKVAVRKFCGQQHTYEGIQRCGVLVVRADGTLREPDHVIPGWNFNTPVDNLATLIWDNIMDDEAALSWRWTCGRLTLEVNIRPVHVTAEMQSTVNQEAHRIRGIFADRIDWTEVDLWMRDPLAGLGWGLESVDDPGVAVLQEMIDAINQQANVVTSEDWHPFARYHKDNNGIWELTVESGFESATGLLDIDNVRRFQQMMKDYICHRVVVERHDWYREMSAKYEQYRTLVEKHDGQMVNLGMDGYLVIREGIPELYGLDDGDLTVFEEFCQLLSAQSSDGTTSQS